MPTAEQPTITPLDSVNSASEPDGQMPTMPLSDCENSDAIALRSAISILQIQREQCRADIRLLESLKHDAVAEPDLFLNELASGRLRKGRGTITHFGAQLGTVAENDGASAASRSGSQDNPDGGDAPRLPSSRFGPIPLPQNVVRCPPINWDKYHVVGESLVKLHREQQLRPSTASLPSDGAREPVAVVAAPYAPFADRVHAREHKATEDKDG